MHHGIQARKAGVRNKNSQEVNIPNSGFLTLSVTGRSWQECDI